jgi:hypothetical protein
MKYSFKLAAIAAASVMANAAYAGPFILAGTDADDHGSATATANVDGWLFMQKSIENIGAAVTNGAKIVYSLGSNVGSQAYNAAFSAFSKSSLATSGWTFQNVNTAVNITTFLQGGAASAGIIMLDSSSSNVSGGLDASEQSALSTNASFINTFVGSGGGLFSQANNYAWLTALVPTLTVNFDQESGLALTAAGNAAFPGLTNSDLSSGPYHANFTNVGALPVLAKGIGSYAGYNVILGASGGSITVPVTSVPEPETYALMLAGLGLMGVVARRRKAKQAK